MTKNKDPDPDFNIDFFFSGIFVFVALVCTFYHANSVVTREVSRNGRRASWPLLIVMINLTACIGLIYFVFEDQKLYEWYIFQKHFFLLNSLTLLFQCCFYAGLFRHQSLRAFMDCWSQRFCTQIHQCHYQNWNYFGALACFETSKKGNIFLRNHHF